MSLLTIAEAQAAGVGTSLDDPTLQAIIDREESAVALRFGTTPDGTTALTEEREHSGLLNVYTRWPIASVSSVSECELGGTLATVDSTLYHVWKGQGRLQRLYARWAARVSIVYVPTDQRPLWKQVLIELCRLSLEQTALKSESIGGEYSYTAPDSWEERRAAQYQRLQGFMEV